MKNFKTYKSIWFDHKNKCSIKNLVYSQQLTNETVVVESYYSLISQGSERIVFGGRVPDNIASNMMIPYQINGFDFPFNYGYSLVGKVVDGPSDFIDEFVHILHPHTSMAFVKRNECTLIPKNISLERAALLSQMQTAITAVWDAKIVFGDRVLIMGYGLIGALIASLLRDRIDLEVFVCEPNEDRLNVAQSMGCDTFCMSEQHSDFDVVFYCTSNTGSLHDAFVALKNNAKLVQVAWFGDDNVTIDLGGLFHIKRLQWISSQVSQLPSHLNSRWSFKSRNELAFKCLNNANLLHLSQQVTSFKDLGCSYHLLLDHSNLLQLIQYK